MTSRRAIGAACLALLMLLVTGMATAMASPQDDVDALIARIAASLSASLQTPNWQASYALATKNIEDLKNTLQYGGKVSSNPVKKLDDDLAALMEERRNAWQVYTEAQEKLMQLRKTEAKGTINDIGAEMIRRLTPKPGVLDIYGQSQTGNMQTIKDDFARLRTYDDAIKKIDEYKKSILPAIHDVRDRKYALQPLLVAYAALASISLDGSYEGHFEGIAAGTIKFVVTGDRIAGTMHGLYKGVDPISAQFAGSITGEGVIAASATGTLTDSTGWIKDPIPSTGSLDGTITGSIGSGTWSAATRFDEGKGGWSAARVR